MAAGGPPFLPANAPRRLGRPFSVGTSGRPERRRLAGAVHGVQHLVHPPIHMTAWPDADRRSRLVFIVDGLDRSVIERSLQAFLRLGSGTLPPAAA
ncbi:MAG: hypothetical protein QOE49_2994 [Rhodospirillaceae bacterium]|jgi:hypothetical protein|nr:hypothetical protein [Rhodospirillaceae bacterium]